MPKVGALISRAQAIARKRELMFRDVVPEFVVK